MRGNRQGIVTEITHLSSGCGLELRWNLAEAKHGQHSLEPPQSEGHGLLAKEIKESSGLNNNKRRASGGLADLPVSVKLAQVKWFGCAWANERLQEKVDDPNKSKKPKPTLPNGAKSTRAIGYGK